MPQKDSIPTRSDYQPGRNGPDTTKDEASSALRSGLTAGVRDLSSEVQHVAADVAGEARKVAESKIGAGKDQAAEKLGAVANALRHTTEQLRSQDNPLTDYVEKAASSVDGFSTYLQTRTLSQLIGDVEGFARREPAIFLGGAFFAGLLGGRFLKSATPAPRTSTGATGANRGPAGEPWSSEPARQATPAQLGMGSSTAPAAAATASTPAGNPSKPASPSTMSGAGTPGNGSTASKDNTPKTPETPKKPTGSTGNGNPNGNGSTGAGG